MGLAENLTQLLKRNGHACSCVYLTKIKAVIWTKGCNALEGAWPKLGTLPVCMGLIANETGLAEA
jgi:hypothetical protein